MGKRELFFRCARECDKGFREVSYFLEKILDCLKKVGSIENVREIGEFSGDTSKKILEMLQTTDNVFRAMENYMNIEDKKTAVVGIYQFYPLDRQVLPEDYDQISIKSEGKFEVPDISVLDSYKEVVDIAVESIRKNRPENVAVVVSRGSVYDSLLRNRLKTGKDSETPFLRKESLADRKGFKRFLELFENVLSPGIKVKDVYNFLRDEEVDVSVKDFDRKVSDLEAENAERFRKKLEKARNGKTRDLTVFESLEIGKETRNFLKKTGMWEQPVAEETLSSIRFLAENYSETVTKGINGVLFVEPCSVAFIDRPVVLYLGMDSSWNVSRTKNPWTDREFERTKEKNNFISMVQSGDRQLYLVQDFYMGEKIVPCDHVSEVFGLEVFTEKEGLEKKVWGRGGKEKGFKVERTGEKKVGSDTFSQSSLNSLVRCPKDYFFSKIVEEQDRDYFVKGTGFHDFAELYFHRPGFVRENLGEIQDFFMQELEQFVPERRKPVEMTEIETGIGILMEFIDSLETEKGGQSKGYEKDRRNMFAEEFGVELGDGFTELRFRDEDIGVKGIIDLVNTPTSLMDYKSGRQKSSSKVFKNSVPWLFEPDRPNFQALMYLLAHSEKLPGKDLSFSFVHFLNAKKEFLSEEELDIDNLITRIEYHPNYFKEYLMTEKGFRKIIGDVKEGNKRRKTLEKLGFEEFNEFLDREIDTDIFTDKDDAKESSLAQKLKELCLEKVGDYKYVRKGVNSAMKRMADIRCKNFFRQDAEKFREFLEEQQELFRDYLKKGFPVGDIDFDTRLDNKDMVMRGEGL